MLYIIIHKHILLSTVSFIPQLFFSGHMGVVMAKVNSYSLSSHIPAVHPLFHLPSPSSYKSLPCLGETFFLAPQLNSLHSPSTSLSLQDKTNTFPCSYAHSWPGSWQGWHDHYWRNLVHNIKNLQRENLNMKEN